MHDDRTNRNIIKHALSKVGEKGGQCKVFVQDVVRESIGLQLPLNHPRKKHCWQHPLPAGVYGFNATSAEQFEYGDIVQVLWDHKKVPVKYHWHTTFCLGRKSRNNFWFVDSNMKGDEVVRKYSLSYRIFDDRMQKCTVYRIRQGDLEVDIDDYIK